jgi:major membrane immunogen (membrane-anchored lipoprotein)
MKTKHFVAMMLIAFALLTSCKKEDTLTTTNIVTAGTWRVSYFNEENDDNSADFSGYTFTFEDNGTMTATKNGVTETGTWSTQDNTTEFYMTIGNSKPLTDLSSGWTIIEKTETSIKLKDDNAAKNEQVYFTKN